VRYRYDPERKRRFKTVEIIVDERPWEPPAPRLPDDSIVGVRVDYDELEIRERVKAAGGIWIRPRRVWELTYRDAVRPGLGDRIVADVASIRRCRASSQRHSPVDAREAST
jgi:hypothetical protein